MKTNLVKIIIGSTLTLALAATVALSARAADQVKGAQLLLAPSQTQVAPGVATPAPVMKCPDCKNVLVTGTRTEKGHITTTTITYSHTCAGCKDTTSVIGFGKAKKEVANHTCSMSGNCCGGA